MILQGLRWCVLAAMVAGSAQAECRLALLLGFDVSRSISSTDYEIQRSGLLAALADPAVRAAFLKPADPVAFAVFEWSGPRYQAVVTGWTEVHTASDLDAIASTIAAHQRGEARHTTALGEALAFGYDLLKTAPPMCATQVIDMSGDGRNNNGRSPATVYLELDFDGITVNGLAIGQHEVGLDAYYRSEVIHGLGAFVEDAPLQVDFPKTIRRKLLRELTERVMGQSAPHVSSQG
jgi:hypothetical protein